MTDHLIRALERRVRADINDIQALKRLAAVLERAGGQTDPAAEARAISRDLYWLDVRTLALESIDGAFPASRLVNLTGRLRGPEEQGEVLAHSHWRGSRDAQEAFLHDIMSEVRRIRRQATLGRGVTSARYPEHGARVMATQPIRRDWFVVPTGATGTVTTSGVDGIGVRLDEDLRGASGDDFDNTVMWLDDDIGDFWSEVERIA